MLLINRDLKTLPRQWLCKLLVLSARASALCGTKSCWGWTRTRQMKLEQKFSILFWLISKLSLLYSGGSNTKHWNNEPIRNNNVMFGFGMVQYQNDFENILYVHSHEKIIKPNIRVGVDFFFQLNFLPPYSHCVLIS